jgi:hypothetical protein
VKKILWTIGILFTLTGCANNYETYYHGLINGSNLIKNPNYVLADEPTLVMGKDPKQDTISMMENGYTLLGYSSFIAPNNGASSERKAIMQGENVHASKILLYSNYADTINKIVPLYSPSYSSGTITDNYGNSANYEGSGGSMSYIPVSVNRNNYLATYWIKVKRMILGIYVRDLTDDEHHEINTNKGVSVIAVVKKSPAYFADIFKGDIILRFDGEYVFDKDDFLTKIKDHKGETINLDLMRDGKLLAKGIKTNP